MINATDSKQWLEVVIPHRLRCVIAHLGLLQQYLKENNPDPPTPTRNAKIRRRCETDAIWEARLAALRWLIEFVGITLDEDEKPKRPKKRRGDVGINDLEQSNDNRDFQFALTGKNADMLAKYWAKCSRISSHATKEIHIPNKNLPVIHHGHELEEPIKVIIDHLQKTIYKQHPDFMLNYVLIPAES